MPERIPQLDQLSARAKEVPMLPPSEIRRLGARRRATRRAVTTVGVAALAVAAGFGLYSSPLLDGLRDEPMWATTASPSPEPTRTPSPTPTVTPPVVDPTQTPVGPSSGPTGPATPARTLGWVTVPGVEAFFPPEALDAGKVMGERTELGGAKGVCDPGEVGSPNAVLVREIGGVDNTEPFGWASVLQYDSAADATRAFRTIRDAALACEEQMTDAGLTNPRTADYSADVPFDATTVDADPVAMAYLTGSGLIPDADEGIFSSTLVLQAGDRVLWLAEKVQGMDYNCGPAPDNDAEQCAMPAALAEAARNLLK